MQSRLMILCGSLKAKHASTAAVNKLSEWVNTHLNTHLFSWNALDLSDRKAILLPVFFLLSEPFDVYQKYKDHEVKEAKANIKKWEGDLR